MKVIIMRGTSGSGKSTRAQELAEHMVRPVQICSADNYFLDPNGNYNFDPTKLDSAHQYCYREFIKAFYNRCKTIIVDNTNTMLHEMSPYIMHAKYHNADIEIVRCVCSVEKCIERNIHDVSAKSIESMYSRMQKIPKYWPQEMVIVTG